MKRFHPAVYAGVSTVVVLVFFALVGGSARSIVLGAVFLPVIFWTIAKAGNEGRPIPRWLPLTLGIVGVPLFGYQLSTLPETTFGNVFPFLVALGFAVSCLWIGLRPSRLQS